MTTNSYDLAVLGGRVMDPETRLDAVRNIGVTDGKIVAITKAKLTGTETINAKGLETFAFIYNPLERAGLSTFDLRNMTRNDDDGVTLYFGPEAPEGLESNWIPTSGKKPFPVMRFYGGAKEFWDKSWTMPDVELVAKK